MYQKVSLPESFGQNLVVRKLKSYWIQSSVLALNSEILCSKIEIKKSYNTFKLEILQSILNFLIDTFGEVQGSVFPRTA